MLECFEQEGPVVDCRNTDLLVCAPSGVALRCLAQGKADRMSAWRPGRWPVFLILSMPAGAADAADDADSRSQRDNPRRKKRQRNTNHAYAPHQLVRSKPRRLSFKFRAKNLGFFAFFWSRLALQPENRCRPFESSGRERAPAAFRTSTRELSRDRATLPHR